MLQYRYIRARREELRAGLIRRGGGLRVPKLSLIGARS